MVAIGYMAWLALRRGLELVRQLATLRPARANSTIRRQYSATSGGWVRGIEETSLSFFPVTVYETGSTPV